MLVVCESVALKSVSCSGGVMKMFSKLLKVLVAAFAVSSYASTATRCAHKPFNPLLGETFECIREEQGWKYIAEQVWCLLDTINCRQSIVLSFSF
jgi:Oxysterol-binding protein